MKEDDEWRIIFTVIKLRTTASGRSTGHIFPEWHAQEYPTASPEVDDSTSIIDLTYVVIGRQIHLKRSARRKKGHATVWFDIEDCHSVWYERSRQRGSMKCFQYGSAQKMDYGRSSSRVWSEEEKVMRLFGLIDCQSVWCERSRQRGSSMKCFQYGSAWKMDYGRSSSRVFSEEKKVMRLFGLIECQSVWCERRVDNGVLWSLSVLLVNVRMLNYGRSSSQHRSDLLEPWLWTESRRNIFLI